MIVSHPTRNRLLAGVSAGAMLLGISPAIAGPGATNPFARVANPAAQAAQAAAAQAATRTATTTASQRALAAFAQAAAVRAKMDAAQAAARIAAAAVKSAVPNGLGAGGLQVDPNAATDPSLWIGAKAPTQTTGSDGRTKVEIEQTKAQAILNWQTFNVGQNTDLSFGQQSSSWVALNRVTDPSANPTQILGTIKAPGTVLIMNANGVIFGGASQVNVGNLVAAAGKITDTQFLNNGIYSQNVGGIYAPSITDALGTVQVQAGAQITTNAAASVTIGGGYVALLGGTVENDGTITTPKGQALLAAGDAFNLRPGYGTQSNQDSTTRGNEVAPVIAADSVNGTVTNAGEITSTQGDITLAGRTVTQAGVAIATTSVNQRGTIHLLNSATDTAGSVTLTGDSLTTILPELDSVDTALDSQRDALVTDSTAQDQKRALESLLQPGQSFDDLSLLADREDQSRVEIVTGGKVKFGAGSYTIAQGGQIAVSAGNQVTAENGAWLDVSGVRDVALDASTNQILVNVQGNELRDAPVNRDDPNKPLYNQDVWVDINDLIYVPAGTGGYATDRYYTAGGLLEVSGYLSNVGHTIGEWASVGGTITLQSSNIVAQQGSMFNLAGGSLDYQAGKIQESILQGADGKIYTAGNAPANVDIVSVGRSFSVEYPRWGSQYTETYQSPFAQKSVPVDQAGYVVGRDGGTLVLSAPNTQFAGDVDAEVVNGQYQTSARQPGITDGYKSSQGAVALAGALLIGTPQAFGPDTPVASGVTFGDQPPADTTGTIWLDAKQVSGWGLGGLTVLASGPISVEGDLSLANGGALTLDTTGTIDIAGTVTAHSGSVSTGAPLATGGTTGTTGAVTLHDGAVIDTRGLFTNTYLDSHDMTGLAYVDGGSVTLGGNVTLESGSLIDASGGGFVSPLGQITIGKGGDISLAVSTGAPSATNTGGSLVLGGTVRSNGSIGGKLSIQADNVSIGDSAALSGTTLAAGTPAPLALKLTNDLTLSAGETFSSDIVLADPVTLPTGTVIPFDLSFKVSNVAGGQTLTTAVKPNGDLGGSEPLLTQASWTIPNSWGTVYVTINGNVVPKAAGTVLPKGTEIYNFGNTLPVGTTIPADVFPNGLSITPYTVNVAAGTTLMSPTVVSAGTRWAAGAPVPEGAKIAAGTVLTPGMTFREAASIVPVLNLTPQFFQQGFSSYAINGRISLDVVPGTNVQVAEPVFQQNGVTLSTQTGANPTSAFSLVLNPVYLENPAKGTLTQRPGASISLTSGVNPNNLEMATGGTIDIGMGSRIDVDPGQRIEVASQGQITIDGSLVAHGGSIDVLNNPTVVSETADIGLDLPLADPGARSIWIGGDALLDVSGQAYIAQDQLGRTYGITPNGGEITLGSVDGADPITNTAYAANAFIVLRPGAVLNADGAHAQQIDLAAGTGSRASSQPVILAGSGGSIALRSYLGIYDDGTMSAKSGGASAAGGTLSLVLESPVYALSAGSSGYALPPVDMQAGRVLTIGANYVPTDLPDTLEAGQDDRNLTIGQARIGAQQIEDGGFDNVSLWGRTAIVFDDDVSLHAGQSLSLNKGAIYDTSPTGQVSLSAPYVLLAGQTDINQPGNAYGHYYVPNVFTAPDEAASLHVAASLIDVRNTVRPLFADTSLTSAGDLRFLASTNVVSGSTTPQKTQLQASGNLELTAEQVYPDTGAQAVVYAGVVSFTTINNNPQPNFDPDSILTIASVDGVNPALPYSVFGAISFYAPEVRQGGIVRAPLGSITLGGVPGIVGTTGTQLVELLPNSITSVSADGLVMPYGGTTDGVTYTVNGGAPIAPNLFTGELTPGLSNSPVTGVTLNGVDVRSDAGSLLDLSGGGTLTGAGFVSGRGGSVDVLTTSLANANPVYASSTGGNGVYAIVPGARVAPTGATAASAWTGDLPAMGQQITIGAGVPGLPAGTYTLMPASYALLPGAFRVELGAPSTTTVTGAVRLSNGSYATVGTQGVANTAIHDALATQLVVTPGTVVRAHSQYNEESYGAFEQAQAATFGTLPSLLPNDGKFLTVRLNPLAADATPELDDGLQFKGRTNMAAGDGGYGGYLVLTTPASNLTITGTDSDTLRSSTVTTVSATSINAVGAPNLYIGQPPLAAMTNGSNPGSEFSGVRLNGSSGPATIELESGADLVGSQIVLTAIPPYGASGSIILDPGSSISTLGSGVSAPGLETGYLFNASSTATLVATNGQLGFTAHTPNPPSSTSITIGDGASVYAEGSLSFLADGVNFQGAEPRIGARILDLELPSINVGSADALAAAAAGGVLPVGLDLDQTLLDRLLNGDPSSGAPAVQQLTLAASNSLNFYGSTDLDARGGQLQTLVLETPAIYGYGNGSDVVNVNANTLVWNGATTTVTSGNTKTTVGAAPGAVIPGGPGTGQGEFNLNADTIVFGYPDQSQPTGTISFDRLMLGFSTVNFNAAKSITANHRGTLSVYATGPDPSAGFDSAHYAGTGGDLNFNTPLLTADSGAVIAYRAGGALDIAAPAGSVAPAASSLGGEIDLAADTINADSTIALPTGRLVMTAANDINLGKDAQIDLSGRGVGFFDVSKATWGGDVLLESTHGNIVQQAGSVINVSGALDANGAPLSDAGSVSLTATDAGQGAVLLGGTMLGQGVAGGEGEFDIRAQRIGADPASLSGDFAALNTALDTGGFFGGRSFDLKQGSLAIATGQTIKAHTVDISVDGGSLTVDGTVDASGAAPGAILLAARDDLTLSGTGLLDAHGTVLQVDSYGQPIEAKNRGTVELVTTSGMLDLQAGSTIDLSSPDGVARGRIDLDAPRTSETSGDIRVSAAGPLTIRGAESIALNGFWSYSPTDVAGTIEQDNGDTTPVGANGAVGLNQIDQRSQLFMTAALTNTDLAKRTAGLSAYGTAYHLRPGVEITGADTPGGNLTVVGDLDLSGYRYGPNADRNPTSVTYGAGDPMALILRASGDLKVAGSISDGFNVTGFKGIVGNPGEFSGVQVVSDSKLFHHGKNPYGKGTGYFSSTDVYITSDFKIPNDAFYINFGGLQNAITGQNYQPGQTVPAGTLLSGSYGVAFEDGLSWPTVATGIVSKPVAAIPSRIPLAPMLAAGVQSASIRLVAGADLTTANPRIVQAATALDGVGNMILSDAHKTPNSTNPIASVIRTGTGDLDLEAGGDLVQESLFGIYTAGTQIVVPSDQVPPAGSYYVDHGGNLLVSVQGNLGGFAQQTVATNNSRQGIYSNTLSNWLVAGTAPDGTGMWSIRFGANAPNGSGVLGFSGFGALGGGNVTLLAGGDAGTLSDGSGGGIVAAVGSSGFVSSVDSSGGVVTGGTLSQMGGGNLTLDIGGRLNPGTVQKENTGNDSGNGDFADLRGKIDLVAGAIGTVPLTYDGSGIPNDPRAPNPAEPTYVTVAWGGPTIEPGDGQVQLQTRGDLALGGVGNPTGDAFSLWMPDTAISLASAGGNLVPYNGNMTAANKTTASSSTGSRYFLLPSTLDAVAFSGSIFTTTGNSYNFELTSSPDGELEFLAQQSIYGLGSPSYVGWGRWNVSGSATDWNTVSSPFKPGPIVSPASTADGVTAIVHAGDTNPIRLYAVDGDITNFTTGESTGVYANGVTTNFIVAAKAAQVRAGRDIVNFGNSQVNIYSALKPAVIMNTNDTDVSVISAGRDMFYTNVLMAGPGELDVSAGRNLYQGDNGIISSIGLQGNAASGAPTGGAAITLTAGVGANGPNYADFAKLYFDNAHLADKAIPDTDPRNAGKVPATYEDQLYTWLKQRFGYAGSEADALTYFLGLPSEQQGIFVRQVFYTELDAGGKEFNDPDSKRFQSYLRGRDAIAALFPSKDANGKDITYTGDITMFGPSGVQTQYGGSINVLTPGGQTLIGVEGPNPPGSAGLITQGSGDIDIYSLDSVLLGQSRIMTTFGGNILVWSAQGDINAGRGAKTDVVYTPPRRLYDDYGNVTLSPVVPSTGAGIATLDPIPEVAPGDINLVAPLGTVDAGEAGIRVSGNVNVAALHVVNAANIQVKGNATGLPAAVAVNTNALSAASSAASAVSTEAEQLARRAEPRPVTDIPTILRVRFVGFGDQPE